MKFAVVLLGFLIAEEIITLDPVGANNPCSSKTGRANCEALWYCAYNNSETKCVPDPCFKVQADDTLCEEGTAPAGVTCQFYPGTTGNTNLAAHDCSSTTSNGGYCASAGRTAGNGRLLDYCAYAALRDGGTCPQSICKKDNDQDNNCVSNVGVTRCTMLSEGDCKLEPKCYYKGGQCLQDPCFAGTAPGLDPGSITTNENQVCSTWIPTTAYSGVSLPAGLAPGDCSKEYKPYKNGGGLTTYCIHKDHSDDPNLCYFLGYYGNDTESPDDFFKLVTGAPTCSYEGTYPTYREFTGCILNPQCTATVAGCDGVQECTTKYNPSGAFAGQYCGDATHGAATSLRIPSLIALLVIAFFAFFN